MKRLVDPHSTAASEAFEEVLSMHDQILREIGETRLFARRFEALIQERALAFDTRPAVSLNAPISTPCR